MLLVVPLLISEKIILCENFISSDQVVPLERSEKMLCENSISSDQVVPLEMSEKIMLCENSISSDQGIFYTYIIGGSTVNV